MSLQITTEMIHPILFAINPNSSNITRNIKESIIKFIENIRYNIVTPLPFETYPEDIYTTPLIREHHDLYLLCLDAHSLIEDDNNNPFSIIFNNPPNASYTKHIYPSNIFKPISQVFLAFLTKLEDLNNSNDQHIFLPLLFKPYKVWNLILKSLI